MTDWFQPSLSALLSRWRADPNIGGRVTAWRTTPPRPALLAAFPPGLHPALRQALEQRGIESLYSHQAQAFQTAAAGDHVVLATGTASGKTLAYHLPVLNALLADPQARALYLFPTKALAQDQLDSLDALLRAVEQTGAPSIAKGVYDGDTAAGARSAIRTQARVVYSNPDMLHTGVLPHHTLWAAFLRGLRFVVVDEMHTYRGVFGSHVANVLRRLRRVAAFYGAYPQFILTSATIANPQELAERLVEAPVTVIDEDGSARGARHFLIYNPPVVDAELGIRRSSLLEGVRLSTELVRAGVQTILFGRTRRAIELLLTYLRQELPEQATGLRGYRSGYLPRERREIEAGLRQGAVRAVAATTALELGIDIGGMGAAVLVGYPGTIAATRQQAGRAGRGKDAAAAILVASADPIDQFLAQHPEYLFDRSAEHARVNPDNLLILYQHLRCAAFELPFRAGEHYGSVPVEVLSQLLQALVEDGALHPAGDRYFWMADQYPAANVSLRSASPDTVVLRTEVDGQSQTIATVDAPSAQSLAHPGAVYLHEGQSYLVERLDLDNKTAVLTPGTLDYYTMPQAETTVEKVSLAAEQDVPAGAAHLGEVLVTRQLTGFRKVRWYTHEVLGLGKVELPPTQLFTTGYWLTFSEDAVARLQEAGLWNNDPNDYGLFWPQIRDAVRQRDGYRCQMCGTLEIRSPHHVHHKVPFRSFADKEQANRLDNLITLCPGCHRRAETAVRVRTGLAGLAYALGQLAPLFLMCDQRDLGYHADPESPLGDGRPTVVLYDMAPAGIGLSEKLFEIHPELVAQTLAMVSGCPCTDGCPACTGPAGENGFGGKAETIALLAELNQDEGR